MSTRPLTGGRVLAITLCAFGVVIGANLTLVFFATGSFPGLVVPNSYVASQSFDRDRVAQEGLGWAVRIDHTGGVLTARMTAADGTPLTGLDLTARIARPATDAGALTVELLPGAEGYRAAADLAPGLWRLDLIATGPGGAHWQAEARLSVPEVKS